MKINSYPGEIIREERKKLKLTQQELAIKCNISRSSLVKIENGELVPKDDWIIEIASYLNLPFEKLRNIFHSYYKGVSTNKGKGVHSESSVILSRIRDNDVSISQIIDKWDNEFEKMNQDDRNQNIFINAMIIRNDMDFNEFNRNYSVIKKYRDGRPIIERFQFVIYLLTQLFEKNQHLNYRIGKITTEVDDRITLSHVSTWFKEKRSSVTSKNNFHAIIQEMIYSLEHIDKNYSDLIIEYLHESIPFYSLSSKLSHAYELIYPDIAKIENIASSDYDNFQYFIERMYVTSDFILNALNGVKIYEITDGEKIAHHLKYADSDDLYDFL